MNVIILHQKMTLARVFQTYAVDVLERRGAEPYALETVRRGLDTG